MAFLTHTDPTRNINRFYFVDMTPTCSGEWALPRVRAAWLARYPAPQQLLTRPEEAQATEERTIKRRLQRGYTASNFSAAGARHDPTCTKSKSRSGSLSITGKR